MPRNLDLAALRSFIAVAETGGVTRAAQRLHLTQSGVSMQLKRLEDSLDIRLLAREGRGVSLTRAGEELLVDARRLIALNDELWAKMTRPEVEGTLTLGMPHDIVHPFAPLVLKRFSEDFPGVRVSLVSRPTTQLLKLWNDGEVDVIVTTEEGVERGGETLEQRRLLWAGAPGGRAWTRRPVPMAIETNCAFRKISFDALDRGGQGWDWKIETTSDDAVIASVAADLAIISVLEGTTPPQLDIIDHGGALPELPMININLYCAGGAAREASEKLAAYVRDAFALAAMQREPRRRAA